MLLRAPLATCAAIAVTVLLLGGAARPAHSILIISGLYVQQIADASVRFTLSGTVASVDYASNTVTVKTGGQTVDVVITPTTVIEAHGETGSIADIRKGSKISASGVVRNGRKVALSIVLK